MPVIDDILSAYRALSSSLDALVSEIPVLTYNVLSYAWDNHEAYLRMALGKGAGTVMLGMNPGPYGMAQKGVPFGAVSFVRTYLGIDGKVGHPANESPLRPIVGMDIRRDEASGKAVWTMASHYGSRDEFLSRCTVLNYCPLLFLDEKGRNLTPDCLQRDFRSKIEDPFPFFRHSPWTLCRGKGEGVHICLCLLFSPSIAAQSLILFILEGEGP